MSEIVVMAALGAISWLLRVSCVVLIPADRLPDHFVRALGHLAPAVLASICAVELTAVADSGNGGSLVATLGIAALVAEVARRSQSLNATATAGLIGVLVVDLLLP